MGKNNETHNIFQAVTEVHENVEKSIRRTWSNRGMNGWWLDSDHTINVHYKFYPEICWIIGDPNRPHTMAKITGAKSAVHAIATYELNVGIPLGMFR